MQIARSEEVADALARGRGVVALESTIISHGFPYPDNLDLAREMEERVRRAGAVPATIAVLGGQIFAGLDEDQVRRLGRAEGVAKCSVRDLAHVCALGGDGATTVAATARIAHMAGIGVFATGGIGGVHRAEEGGRGFDISADLMEMARTPVAVVAAGAKSLLDLPATLEVLETYGVPVVGFGTNEFPAFHTPESGLRLGQRVDGVAELARLVKMQRVLGLEAGMLICNPPSPEWAMERDEVESLIHKAAEMARGEGVKGAAVTPFILAALDRLSEGRTRKVNRELALSNAELAGQLAAVLAGGA